MDESIIYAIQELEAIIDFYYNRNDTVEITEFILERIDDEELVKITLLESIGLFDEDEKNINWNYIIENIYFIIDRIENYINYKNANLINMGYEFNVEVKDSDKCMNYDDMLSMDWVQLDSLDDLECYHNGISYYGTTPSSKKEYEDIRIYY